MHRSVPKFASVTYGHMAGMPRLPVPPLAQTLELYLKTLRPLVTPQELEENKALAAELGKPGGVGETLRNHLVNYAAGEHNWLEKWWDNSYLDIRDPSPVNVNYGLQLVTNKEYSQTVTASKLIAGAVDFKLKLDKEEVAPDATKEGPLCMNQYARLFAHARIPAKDRDVLVNYQKAPEGLPYPHFATKHIDAKPTHICVLANGSFFKLDVLSVDGKPFSAGQIQRGLEGILAAPRGAGQAEAVGNLTAHNRDVWAAARDSILSVPGNDQVFRMIDSALFVVVLDESSPSSFDSSSESLLLGKSGARWFDKHQLIVFKNGVAGANLEHAPADGTAALRLLAHATDYAKQCGLSNAVDSCKCPQSASGVPEWKVAEFKLGSAHKAALDDAAKHRQTLFDSFNTSVLAFSDFGGARLKKHKASPDAFAQIALQLAQYTLNGRLVATYESNSTRGFLHGRTETVRSASQEALEFVQAMSKSGVSAADKVAKLHAAVNAHQWYMKVSKNGEGVDRPMLGLRRMAAMHNIPMPALFTHPAFSRSNSWRLSTSHLGGPHTSLFTFGPVVDDGYGIGYMIHNDSMSFNITGWNHKATPTSAKDFAASMRKALLDMDALCASTAAA